MNHRSTAPRALFVGMTAVDVAYLVPHLPAADEKITALQRILMAGGPATNAAITFAGLGGQARLVSALGGHVLAAIARREFSAYGVEHIDLRSHDQDPPVVSSITITQGTGERSVVSTLARTVDAGELSAALSAVVSTEMSPAATAAVSTAMTTAASAAVGTEMSPEASQAAMRVEDCDVVLLDGHQMPLAQEIARVASSAGVPVVFDGGSWKPGTDELLQFVDYAICSEVFLPTGIRTAGDTLDYLTRAGAPFSAITRGAQPILWKTPDGSGRIVVEQPSRVVDTLAAGDILHGAFVYHLATQRGRFPDMLRQAARTATLSVQSFGPRAWIHQLSDGD